MEALVTETPPLNLNLLYQNIWPYEGRAVLKVERVGTAETTASDETEVIFLEPDPSAVKDHLDALRRCVTTGSWSCHVPTAFFAAVRLNEAADTLVQLMKNHPYLMFAAKAIVAQARERDFAALEEVSRLPEADSRLLRESASALRQAMRCSPDDTPKVQRYEKD